MKPARRREAVDQVRATWQVSIRRACSVLQAERSSYHYRGKRRPQAVLSKRIKEIAETRVRYGYRRIHVLLRREGWRVNAKRVWRLYREMGLQLRNKAPKRRVQAKLREGRCHVNNCDGDNPYRRAVAETRRGPSKLSATIRRFSSSVQRRRAPVAITSSRETVGIGV
jgi:transposase InsO family protein